MNQIGNGQKSKKGMVPRVNAMLAAAKLPMRRELVLETKSEVPKQAAAPRPSKKPGGMTGIDATPWSADRASEMGCLTFGQVYGPHGQNLPAQMQPIIFP